MNKLIKLVLVNLLGLFDYNGVLKEVEAGVKGKSETRLIVVAIASIIYGYLVYIVFNMFGNAITNKSLIIFVGFIVATVMSFIVSIVQVKPIIFNSDDTEYLFSLPLTKHQIILSKVVNIYIRNIFFVFVILLANIIAFSNYSKVNETMVLIYIVNGIFIPFIPIILTVLVEYFNYYIKFNWKKIFNYISKIIVLLVLGIVVYLLFKDINVSNINVLLEGIYERIRFIYPTTLLYVNSVMELDVICFILYIVINIVVIYVFMLFLLKNYNKICSLLKGVKNNKKFIYEKGFNLGNKFGNLRKEFLLITKNKLYFNNSYSMIIVISILLVIVSLFVPVKDIIKVNLFYEYYNLYAPFILAGIISFGNSCINSISLEKDNKEILATLPIKMSRILFYKWLVNVLICSLIIFIDVSIINIMFKPNLFTIIISYVIPLVVVMFISLLSLILDYRFVVKNESDDGVILKQRIITYVPMLLSLLVVFLPIAFKAYMLYKIILSSFILLCILSMLICLLYLVINKKKLKKHLMK